MLVSPEIVNCNSRNFSLCKKDLKFLYEILTQRLKLEPGFSLPDYKTHCNFLLDHKEKYKKIIINSLNCVDYNTFYISSNSELAVYFHLQNLSHIDIKLQKTVMYYSRYMLYNELKNLNFIDFWSRAYKTNITAINSIRRFYKQFISNEYNLEIIEDAVMVKHVFTKKND